LQYRMKSITIVKLTSVFLIWVMLETLEFKLIPLKSTLKIVLNNY